MTNNAYIVLQLRRAQAVFQLRTIATVLSQTVEHTQPPEEQNNIKHTKDNEG